MDRVEEIRKHEAIADRNDATTSEHRWIAAQLIWEEVNEGKSRRQLGQERGKSHTHVRYMFNCWDLVGRKLGGLDADGGLPSFNEIYNSVEVRGDPGEGSGKGSAGGRHREPEDHSAHGLVMTASGAISEIADNPAFWAVMTDEDWIIIRELPAVIRALLRDSGR